MTKRTVKQASVALILINILVFGFMCLHNHQIASVSKMELVDVKSSPAYRHAVEHSFKKRWRVLDTFNSNPTPVEIELKKRQEKKYVLKTPKNKNKKTSISEPASRAKLEESTEIKTEVPLPPDYKPILKITKKH